VSRGGGRKDILSWEGKRKKGKKHPTKKNAPSDPEEGYERFGELKKCQVSGEEGGIRQQNGGGNGTGTRGAALGRVQ